MWDQLGHAQVCQPLHLRAGMFARIRSTMRAWQVVESPGKGSPLVSWGCAHDSMLSSAVQYALHAVLHCAICHIALISYRHAVLIMLLLSYCRRTLRRTIKKSAMLWIRMTPNVPVTSKPAEVCDAICWQCCDAAVAAEDQCVVVFVIRQQQISCLFTSAHTAVAAGTFAGQLAHPELSGIYYAPLALARGNSQCKICWGLVC